MAFKTLFSILVVFALTCPDEISGAFFKRVGASPVCFGANGNRPGRFKVPRSGRMAGVKLVHLYGFVSCHRHRSTNWSPWGCGFGVHQQVNAVITNSRNHILLPPSQLLGTPRRGKWHRIPGYNSMSPVLELKVFHNPIRVTYGQELRLWYGEDLVNYTEGDNGGKACAAVFILYV